MSNQVINFITGLAGFIVWIVLTYSSPDNSINLAVGVLLMLVGFGGRDTIIEIIKTWKGWVVYSRGDLGTCYHLGILNEKSIVVEIVLETYKESQNLWTNPSYKKLSLMDRYAPRRDTNNLLEKFEWTYY